MADKIISSRELETFGLLEEDGAKRWRAEYAQLFQRKIRNKNRTIVLELVAEPERGEDEVWVIREIEYDNSGNGPGWVKFR